MDLTEEQLAAAQEELRRREKERHDGYAREYARRQAEADERHWEKMEAAYPDLSRDTLYDIYSTMRDYYEG
jgi:hypothetical protein